MFVSFFNSDFCRVDSAKSRTRKNGRNSISLFLAEHDTAGAPGFFFPNGIVLKNQAPRLPLEAVYRWGDPTLGRLFSGASKNVFFRYLLKKGAGGGMERKKADTQITW